MLRGLFLSAILHIFLIISFTYLLPYFLVKNSILQISVDIISLEEIEPEIIPEKPIEPKKPKPKPKKQPKPKEPKKDDKIRQIKEIPVQERPKPIDKEAKKPEPKKKIEPNALIDDLPDSEDSKLDDILAKIKQAQNEELKRQKEYGEGPLTDAEIGSIKRQVNSCWFNIYGRVFDETDLSKIQVTIYVALDESGNVVDIRPIEDVESYMDLDNHLYRKVLDSAIHSFIACKKIQNLPKSKYKYWKEFEFSFSPADAY
ncbi:MAG: hypothetical protein ISQ32_03910 [Rickettsiales bacterium]|nr:hypothetical protein [Rickettsiales bacterium]